MNGCRQHRLNTGDDCGEPIGNAMSSGTSDAGALQGTPDAPELAAEQWTVAGYPVSRSRPGALASAQADHLLHGPEIHAPKTPSGG